MVREPPHKLLHENQREALGSAQRGQVKGSEHGQKTEAVSGDMVTQGASHVRKEVECTAACAASRLSMCMVTQLVQHAEAAGRGGRRPLCCPRDWKGHAQDHL